MAPDEGNVTVGSEGNVTPSNEGNVTIGGPEGGTPASTSITALQFILNRRNRMLCE